MKFKSAHLLFFGSLVALVLFFFFETYRPSEKPFSEPSHEPSSSQGNKKTESFQEAKKLARKFYSAHSFKTFYCGCSFEGSRVQLTSCPFKPSSQKSKRAERIEWEHVVPASQFGRYFPSWKKGHKKCRSTYGKAFKGRECARLVSEKFRLMEADLYNLVPAIGEVNALRSNHPVGLLEKAKNQLAGCETKIFQKRIEPRKEVKGMMARIYLYMERNYPGYQIVTRENEHFLKKWAESYPPEEHETRRNRYIKSVQGNSFHEDMKR